MAEFSSEQLRTNVQSGVKAGAKDKEGLMRQYYEHKDDNAAETSKAAAALFAKVAKEPKKVTGADLNEYWTSAQVTISKLKISDKAKGELFREMTDAMSDLKAAAKAGEVDRTGAADKEAIEAAKLNIVEVNGQLKALEKASGRMSEAEYKKWLETPIEPSKSSDKPINLNTNDIQLSALQLKARDMNAKGERGQG